MFLYFSIYYFFKLIADIYVGKVILKRDGNLLELCGIFESGASSKENVTIKYV